MQEPPPPPAEAGTLRRSRRTATSCERAAGRARDCGEKVAGAAGARAMAEEGVLTTWVASRRPCAACGSRPSP